MCSTSIFRCDIEFFDENQERFRVHRDGTGVISYMRLGLREDDFENCCLTRAKVRRVLSIGKNYNTDDYNTDDYATFVREVLLPYMGREMLESTFVRCHLTRDEGSKHLVGVNLDKNTYDTFVEEGWTFKEKPKKWTLKVVEEARDAYEEPRCLKFSFYEETGMWILKTEEIYYDNEWKEKTMLNKYRAESKYSDQIDCWHYDSKHRMRVYQRFYR